jgi:hypothetical protein
MQWLSYGLIWVPARTGVLDMRRFRSIRCPARQGQLGHGQLGHGQLTGQGRPTSHSGWLDPRRCLLDADLARSN